MNVSGPSAHFADEVLMDAVLLRALFVRITDARDALDTRFITLVPLQLSPGDGIACEKGNVRTVL